VTSVRRRAVEALGNLGPEVAPEAIQPLLLAMKDPRDAVREQAVLAVGKYGEAGKAALPALREAAMSDASSVRPEAALSIWRLTKEANSVLPLLRKLLKDGDLPWEAAEVLAEMGPAAEPAVPDLILALDEDETMQIYAAEALGKIGPGARSALPALQKLLDHKEEGVRKTAQRAIAAIEAK
jgi:hypothetical protein